MNNKAKKEKYRKLSIAALVTGLLALVSTLFTIVEFVVQVFSSFDSTTPILFLNYLYGLNSFGLVIGIVSILLGSLDLIKIKSGKYYKKGRGMDTAGVTLGIVFVIFNVFLFYLIHI